MKQIPRPEENNSHSALSARSSQALAATSAKLPAPASPSASAASAEGGDAPLRGELWRPMLAGGLVVALFFAGLGGWAATAPLASAAIAPGVIAPDGRRQTIQHLEGGIIAEILVEDGAAVQAGEPLLILEDVQARAAHDQLLGEHRSLAARQARLLAEQAGAPAIAFPDWLLRDAGRPEVARILEAQTNLFETGRQARGSAKAILSQKIAQSQEEIAGLQATIQSQTDQINLLNQEVAGVSQLLEQGLERKPRLLALQRQVAELDGARAQNQAEIARARQEIGEAELRIVDLDTTSLDKVADELTQVNAELASVQEKLRASEDVLKRTVITAPVAGTVVELRYRTPHGVIAPGAPILDIVPAEDELLIEARVAPTDIDAVHPGLAAQVHLLAYQQRSLPRIEGTVRTVSADALADPETGASYFLARVEVDRERLARTAPEVTLTAGMPAEVLIMTGEQTTLAYLLKPFLDTLRRSFREG